jgi:two-component system sensor histidine kinase DesK
MDHRARRRHHLALSPRRGSRLTRGIKVTTVSLTVRQQPRPRLRSRLRGRGAYQWYAGTIFGLAYQPIEIVNVWVGARPLSHKVVATILLGLLYAAYLVIPPLAWPETVRTRVIVLVGYWVASLALAPFIGVDLIWIWPLLGAMVAFSWMPAAPSFILAGGIVVVQLAAAALVNFADGIILAPFITATVLICLFGITRQIMANQELRAAQLTIASLAAAEERARLARDLHDVLGHSLTVVAVKSELAGRLVELDPTRAVAEIADIESLARTALADLRAAVTSYREMSLDSELRAARTALEAAGIEPHVPPDGTAVADDLRPLFGWVVREGVTNVIRHSRASGCWIELDQYSLRVRDNGPGPAKDGDGNGNGLHGLRERAREAGAELSAASGADGGFVLSVERALA